MDDKINFNRIINRSFEYYKKKYEEVELNGPLNEDLFVMDYINLITIEKSNDKSRNI